MGNRCTETGTPARTAGDARCAAVAPALGGLDAHCLFLDFDGTLVDIAARPDLIRFDRTTLDLVSLLEKRLGNAIAIVSGREISDIDRFFAPLVLPVAGVHGQIRRNAFGRVEMGDVDHQAVGKVASRLGLFVAREPGLLLELKAGAVAVHYRARPDLAELCLAEAVSAIETHPDLHVVRGIMVVEVKSRGYSKGTAIRAFMREPPFAGRIPVFAGDDLTDEDGFVAVNRLGGISIKVGPGVTVASFRVARPQQLLAWLHVLAHPTSETGQT